MSSEQASDLTAGYAAWQRGVAGVLAKARKVDPAELPADPESLLAAHTYDGITIAPLYTRRDEHVEEPLPGNFPFVRGRDARRDVVRGWHVGARFTGTDAGAVNRSILNGLENGVSAIWLAVAPDDISAALSDVLVDLAPVTLDAGAATEAAAQHLFAVLDRADTTQRSAVSVGLGAAPLTSSFAGIADTDLATAVELARHATQRPEAMRAITVDATAFHNAGAGDAQELGAGAAATVEYLRAMSAAGMAVPEALRQLECRFAATDDQFATIAKFRAARRIWSRIAQVCGASDDGNTPQHAVTSAAMMTQRDPWVNMLRTTLAAFGAGLGGADVVTVLPFDSALPDGALGVSESFAARMARNTQLLLLEEAHVGRVLDPGAGSWYVEDLTAALAAKAWEFLQAVEQAGGYRAALDSGFLAEQIDATRTRRESDVAHRRTAVTGVNEFPNLAEKPFDTHRATPVARYAAAFEALRDRSDAYLGVAGTRPRALLVPLGPVAEHNPRVTFAANLLASGGIESVNPGPLAIDGIAAAAKESESSVAVLCGSDERYGVEAGAAIAALRSAGIGMVLLAGPGEAMSGTDVPDGFLTARMDAVSELSELLTKLGA